MMDLIDSVYGFYQSWFGDLTLKGGLILAVSYIILHSKTKIGLLLRFLALWIVYNSYNMYAKDGEIYKGIELAATMFIVLFWPLLIRYILRLINYVLDRSSSGGG